MSYSRSNISKQTLTLILAIAAMAVLSTDVLAAKITTPKAVIELFTSQGCSSCPPADAMLNKLNRKGEVLGLAFHVDYWDRLGWKDTFASKEFTQRQWNYARSLGERQVYTPQAIINGHHHVVGSQEKKIMDWSDRDDKDGIGIRVPINIVEKDGILVVSIPGQEIASYATLYAVYFTPTATVKIKRGENSGKTLEYTNIVGKMEMLGMVGSGGMRAEFSIADFKLKGYKGCALILQTKTQDGMPSSILGASVISDL